MATARKILMVGLPLLLASWPVIQMLVVGMVATAFMVLQAIEGEATWVSIRITAVVYCRP